MGSPTAPAAQPADPVTCRKCGREESDPSADFCPSCGAPLRGEPSRQKLRRRLVGLLVFVTIISFVATGVAAWARAVALDTDRFVATAGPLIDDPKVQEALAVGLTGSIMEGAEIRSRVAGALDDVATGDLPISPTLFAGPITDGIETFLHDRIRGLLATDAVSTIWYSTLETAHSQAVALLRGQTDLAAIEGDTVYIDLLPVANQALSELEGPLSDLFNRTVNLPEVTPENAQQAVAAIEQQLGVDLPDDFAQLPVFSSDALPTAQAGVAAADKLVWALVVFTLVLAIVTVVLAPDRRRILLWLGFGSALGLIVVRRLTLRIDDALVERISDQVDREAVGQAASALFQDLKSFTTLALLAAIAIGVAAYLAGKPPWITRTIERTADGSLIATDTATVRWVGVHAGLLKVAVLALGGIALLVLSLGWASMILVIVLAAASWWILTYLQTRSDGTIAP